MSSNYHRSREPWYRRWFGRHERTEDEGLGSNALQSNFNFAALATLLLPLLFLLIARIVIRDGENWWNWDMDGDGEGWWNGEWDREKWQGIATWLTLLLSLLVFFGIVYQGNYVLGRRTNDRNLKPLVAALFVFALMSLALAIMFSAFGGRPGEEDGEGEFLARFATFHGWAVLMFLFWAIFAFAFAFHLRSRIRSFRRSQNGDNGIYRDGKNDGLI